MSRRNAGLLSGGRFSSSRARYVMSAWICCMRVLQIQFSFKSQNEMRDGARHTCWCILRPRNRHSTTMRYLFSLKETKEMMRLTISGGACNSGRDISTVVDRCTVDDVTKRVTGSDKGKAATVDDRPWRPRANNTRPSATTSGRAVQRRSYALPHLIRRTLLDLPLPSYRMLSSSR
jgi:hypothetical protein